MKTSWIEQQCKFLLPIEQETIKTLGEGTANFFINAANDCVTVSAAVGEAYPGDKCCNLGYLSLSGLFKEAYWFHFFFVAGNYPVLLGRLRFVWESIFRAYFVEHYPMGPCTKWDIPGPTPEDKVVWLEKYGKDLNWDTCIGPVLRAIFPLADHEQTVRDDVKDRFQYLHRYAHPSPYLLNRMLDEPVLHVRDGFDEVWARQTVELGAMVFDFVWMAVLAQHPAAFERIESLAGNYPIFSHVFVAEVGTPPRRSMLDPI